jgi:hypothetical protein
MRGADEAATGVHGARHRRAALGLAVLLAASACATPYDPFRVPAPELRGRVRTIALAPIRVNADLVDPVTARERLEPLVAAKLAAAGFRIVASEELERLWRSAADDVGGVFDPVTGEADDERYQAVESAVHHELRAQHGVDAVLRMWIDTVELFLALSSVTFCGTTGDAYWPGGTLGTFETATLVRAACFHTVLVDLEERELYGIRAGLETIETYARQTRAERPLSARLADPAGLRDAVDATLGPLAGDAAER